MNAIFDAAQTFAIVGLCYWVWTLSADLRAANLLITEETKRRVAHKELFENLSDPIKIEGEMEANARMYEMHLAKRNHLPREGVEPARMHKAKLRSEFRAKLDTERFDD